MVFNVAIIGAGLIGNKRAVAINSFKECRIKIVVDINKDAAVDLAGRFKAEVETDWERIITRSDIDIIIVSTRNDILAPISISALKNGKHVLCEKPLGRNSTESKKILEASKNHDVVLKTGFNHRHHPAIYRAKQLAANEEIGNIYYIRCIYGHGGRPGYEKEWRASRDLCGGGELLDQGVHVIDLFRWFLGDFDEVYGHTSTFYWDMEVEDNAFAMFKTKNNQLATMHTSWTQWKNKFVFEIFGEKGYLIVDGLGGSYGSEKLIIGKRKTETKAPNPKKNAISFIGGSPQEEIFEFSGPDMSWIEEWKEFINAIKGNREPLGSGYDGFMANNMIKAVYQSAKLNRPIKLGQP